MLSITLNSSRVPKIYLLFGERAFPITLNHEAGIFFVGCFTGSGPFKRKTGNIQRRNVSRTMSRNINEKKKWKKM